MSHQSKEEVLAMQAMGTELGLAVGLDETVAK